MVIFLIHNLNFSSRISLQFTDDERECQLIDIILTVLYICIVQKINIRKQGDVRWRTKKFPRQ